MRSKIDPRVPRYSGLIAPTFNALKTLGGSGSNEEILNQIILDLSITDEVADISHKGNTNMSELQYQLAWARTYMKNYGVIENASRSVWTIKPDYIAEPYLSMTRNWKSRFLLFSTLVEMMIRILM